MTTGSACIPTPNQGPNVIGRDRACTADWVILLCSAIVGRRSPLLPRQVVQNFQNGFPSFGAGSESGWSGTHSHPVQPSESADVEEHGPVATSGKGKPGSEMSSNS